jgi:terminase small subunit-like protein
MSKTDILTIASPGSRPLKNARYERFCRLRALLQPRAEAYREAGWHSKKDNDAYTNACRLERRHGVRERIEFLSHQAEERIVEERRKLQEQLWGMHEANIKDFFEQYAEPRHTRNPKVDENGRPVARVRERPRLLTEVPPELAALIEDVTIDRKGRAVLKLYNKLQASKELRAMLNIGRPEERATDVSRLSDAELVAQLADQAKQLGVEIDLNYRFLKRDK